MKKKNVFLKRLTLIKGVVMPMSNDQSTKIVGGSDVNNICYPGPGPGTIVPMTHSCVKYSDLCNDTTKCPTQLCYSANNYFSQCCV